MKYIRLDVIKELTEDEKILMIDYLGQATSYVMEIEEKFDDIITNFKMFMKNHEGRVILQKLIDIDNELKTGDGKNVESEIYDTGPI